jgi:hypothetical protein
VGKGEAAEVIGLPPFCTVTPRTKGRPRGPKLGEG